MEADRFPAHSNHFPEFLVFFFPKNQHDSYNVDPFSTKLDSEQSPQHDVGVWLGHLFFFRLLESLHARSLEGRLYLFLRPDPLAFRLVDLFSSVPDVVQDEDERLWRIVASVVISLAQQLALCLFKEGHEFWVI